MPIALKIKLNNKSRVYLPGHDIEGTVAVRDFLKSSFTLRALRLRLVGEITTFQTVGAYGKLQEVVPLVETEIDLLEGKTELQVTKEGIELPFSVSIPEHCPPTITVSESNRINYALIAEIPKGGRLSTGNSTKVVIRVAKLRPAEKRQAVFVRMFGDIPFVPAEPVVEYGDGYYPTMTHKFRYAVNSAGGDATQEDEEKDSVRKEKFESKVESYAIEYSDDESAFQFDDDDDDDDVDNPGHGAIEVPGGGVLRHQRVGVFGREFLNNWLPPKHWGIGATHKNQLVLEVVFPNSGVYTDRPLQLLARLCVPGPLPPLVLHMFKVSLVESTFISAKGIGNNERRRHTLMHIAGPIDLTTSSIHELSSELRDAFPPDLAATFSEPTMQRSYALNIHVQYYKGRIEDDVPVAKLHMNARHDLFVLGAADLDPVRPSSSSIFSFRSSAQGVRS